MRILLGKLYIVSGKMIKEFEKKVTDHNFLQSSSLYIRQNIVKYIGTLVCTLFFII